MDRRLPDDTAIASWFKAKATSNGSSPAEAARLWVEVFAFASFGFCKSHAAAFALPTYLSAWLKTHHPAALYAGLLTHDPGMYPRRLIAADARHFGVAILPIDVNASDKVYRVEPVADEEEGGPREGVRLAFSEVRGISEAEMDLLLAARRDGGPFISLEDLWRRAELSRPVLENLVHIGALDSIKGPASRRELLWRAVDLASTHPPEKRSTHPPRSHRERSVPGQLGFELEEPITEALPGLKPYTPMEETEAELAIGSIDARRHVMELYRPLLAELGCVPATELPARRDRSQVWVAGVKVASQTPAIRSGQRIIFVTLDDLTGPIDITVFERAQARCAAVVFHSWLQLIRGTLRKRGAGGATGVSIVAEEVFDLAELATNRSAGATLAEAIARQRARQAAGGLARQTPPKAPSRVWHSSGGSAGR
jgi:error-prone DNA polymerase